MLRVFPFQPQRIVTEGIIHVNAVIVSLLILFTPRQEDEPTLLPERSMANFMESCKRLLIVGFASALLLVGAEFAGVRAMYGSDPAPGAGTNIRFGPDATTKPK